MLEFKPIKFPADESPHRNVIEWWYFNGHLADQWGNCYSFMNCLFRADPKKVKFPFWKSLPFKDIYFSHDLLSDSGSKKFYSTINPLLLISQDSFAKDLFFVNYAQPSLKGYFNYEMEKLDEATWHIKNKYLDLILKNKKPPLLVGGGGFLNLKENSTYYYSLTNLETAGEIIVNKKRIKVMGKSWFDHQWADAVYSNFKWTWFSLQLEDNIEIICFEFIGSGGKLKSASVMSTDGRQKDYEEVEFVPLDKNWQSPKTGAVYPLAWEIKIPSAQADLLVKAVVKNQEMIFNVINYWEGELEISGTVAGKPVKGLGFMELVGYPTKKNRLVFYQKMFYKNFKTEFKKFFVR